MAMYDMTCQFATLEPPPVEMQQLLGAVSTNDDASADFVSVQAGTLPVPEFFDPETSVASWPGGRPRREPRSSRRSLLENPLGRGA